MKTALVGYTGFVGSNLNESYSFDSCYNSKNIVQSYGTEPNLLVYAGIRAEKFIVNKEPEKDRQQIIEAFENIKKIKPQKLVLISTIDVYENPVGVDEGTCIRIQNLHPYGANRYLLETLVRDEFPDASIIRLPGLFGMNMKKNFIFDYLQIIPTMLTGEKLQELSKTEPEILNYYILKENGFYQCKMMETWERIALKNIFLRLNFSALNFTDSRSVFQFYPLKRLWNDIGVVLKNNLKLWNPATEPVSAKEVYYYLTGKEFINELEKAPFNYDYHTNYTDLFGGEGYYILNKTEVLSEIKQFIEMRNSYETCNF